MTERLQILAQLVVVAVEQLAVVVKHLDQTMVVEVELVLSILYPELQ
jgi:hypothetical protein